MVNQLNFREYMVEHQKMHTDIAVLLKEHDVHLGWHAKCLYALAVGVIVALSVATGIAYFG